MGELQCVAGSHDVTFRKSPSRSVSVIIPTYRRPEACKRAILSALKQTYTNREIIIVEDGSVSDIERWSRLQNHNQLIYVRHESNRGLAAARNTGLEKATCEYVAFLDDDDEWQPTKLKRQCEIMDGSAQERLMIYCGAAVYSDGGEYIGYDRPKLEGDLREAIQNHGLSSVPSSILLRREEALEIGGFDERLNSHIDYDFHLTLAKAGFRAHPIDEPLVLVREHDNYRMTTDYRARVQELDRLLEKWGPDLRSWLGEIGYGKLRRGQYSRVGGNLLADVVRRGSLREGIELVRDLADHNMSALVYVDALRVCFRLVISRSPHYLRVKRALHDAVGGS